jgi:hypothetical protein
MRQAVTRCGPSTRVLARHRSGTPLEFGPAAHHGLPHHRFAHAFALL